MNHPISAHPDRMSNRRRSEETLPPRLHSLPLFIITISLINLYLVITPVNGEMSMYSQDIQSQSHPYGSEGEEGEEGSLSEGESVKYVNCTRCSLQSESRARRLLEIKADILNKLGLKSAPNITIKPRELSLPPLQNLLRSNRDNFGHNSLHLPPHRTGQGNGQGYGQGNGQGIDQRYNSDDLNMMMAGDQPIPDDDDFEDFYVSAEKSLSIARNPPKSLNIPKEMKVQYFKFSPKVLNAHVTRAYLWVHVKNPNVKNPNGMNDQSADGRSDRSEPGQNGKTKTAWVVVYQAVRSDPNDAPTLLHIRAQKVQVSASNTNGQWVKVDVKKLVSQWFRHPKDNLGLVVHSYDSEGRPFVIGHPNDNEVLITTESPNGKNDEGRDTSDHGSETGRSMNGESSQIPFIEVRVESKSQNRKKRMVGLNCEENSNEVRCCRYPLTVDFEEFGWDWVIAPKRYEANYCSGECPYVFLQKYPHTHLVQQASPAGASGPCCTPRKMSSISMLYFDDDYNIVYGVLPGMVVDRCGCS